MPIHLEGTLEAEGLRVAVVVTRWNAFVTERLLEGALECFSVHGGKTDDVTVVRCPGAFEIPIVVRGLIATGRFHAIVALGAVIRGATPHFEYVASSAATGIAAASADSGIPVGFGVLTVDTVDQALERAGSKGENKGWEAMAAAIETARLMTSIEAS